MGTKADLCFVLTQEEELFNVDNSVYVFQFSELSSPRSATSTPMAGKGQAFFDERASKVSFWGFGMFNKLGFNLGG